MKKIADIHCHILPYVDDGAENLEETAALLDEEAAQGVRIICVTPHSRTGMFEVPDDDIREYHEHVKEMAAYGKNPIRLIFSREYYCDSRFLKLLENGEVIPLGNGNSLLIEFSDRFNFETICQRVKLVRQHGYIPLIAHVERYTAIHRKVERVEKLVKMGALIQLNAGSILGRDGIWLKRFCYILMKKDLVHIVASDTHGVEFRPPELQLCANYIEKKFGASYTEKVLWTAPMNILRLL